MPAAAYRNAASRSIAVRAFFALAALLLPLTLGAQATPHWLTGYYAIYNYNGVMTTSQVDYTKLSHVIYWPVVPNTGVPGSLKTTDYVSAATFAAGATDLVTRAHAAGTKALIGIGGDNESGPGDQGLGATVGFQISTEPANQATFVSNIVALMQEYGFDGVDINWEQIRTQDQTNFTTFIANLRVAINAAGPNKLLTMAPETQANGGQPTFIQQVYQDFDQINIQTYQMSGPYCGWVTWYNSPLTGGNFPGTTEALPSITNAVAAYTALGIPEGKLAMGIQFDGEVWKGGQGTPTGGVTQPLQGWANENNCGNNPSAPSTGIITYTSLVPLLTTAGYTTNFDTSADQSWLGYDPSGTGTTNEANDEFISYDSPTSLAKKGVDLSVGKGVGGALGGAFMFELSGDYFPTAAAGQQHPLLNAANTMQFLLPGAATGLSASTPAKGEVDLAWTAAPFAAGYKVYTSTCATCTLSAVPVATVTTPAAKITGLTAGTAIWFNVIPYSSFGSSTTIQTSATPTGGTVAPIITWATPLGISYPTALSATQLNATAASGGTPVAGTFLYSPAIGTVLTAGSHSLSVTFTPTNTAAYSAANANVTISVAQGLPVVTWPQPAPITYPTPLSATQLNATSNVPGTFTYTPPAGTVLNIGADSLYVSYVPTDHADYQLVGVTRPITVNGTALTPTITWPQPTSIPFGTELTATQLNASANVAGTFTYTPAAGAVLPAGNDTLTVTFVPSVANYTTTSKSVTLSVTGAGSTLSSSTAFGALNVGALSLAHQFSFTLPVAESLSAVQFLTKGIAKLDFQAAGTASCAIGTTYPAGTICKVDVVFSPTATGLRQGAVVFQGAAGAPLKTIYLTGTGNGPQVLFDPGGLQTWTVPAQFEPSGIAVDGSGAVYASDYFSSKIYKFVNGFSTVFLTPTTVASPQLAIDGAGNLYYMTTTTVVEVYPNLTQKTIMTGLIAAPHGLAVDAAGDVFVSNTNANTVVEYNPVTGTTSILGIPTVVGLGLSKPTGLALDGVGNLFVGDSLNLRVLEVPLAEPALATVAVRLTGTAENIGLATGNNGTLYITDSNGNQILKWNPAIPAAPPVKIFGGTVLNSILAPTGIAVDSSENLYVADLSNERVIVDIRQNIGLAFANTPVGTVSADSPQTVTVENIGNAPLAFSPVTTGVNPTVTGPFLLGTASTCPVVTSASTPQTLSSLGTCTYSISFKPTTASTFYNTLVLADNASNLPASRQQTLYFLGTGIVPPQATVFLGGLAATYTGLPISASATTNPAGLAVSFTYNGSATAPTAPGSYTVVGTITTTGWQGSSTGTLVIGKATPQITWPTPAPIAPGTSLTVTQLDATANVPGTFLYTPALGTIPAAGTATLGVAFTPTNTADYANATASVALTVNAAAVTNAPMFVNQPVGKASNEHSFTFNFTAATTLQSGNPVNVLTIASPNLDFVNTGLGTCAAGTYAAGSSCTVNVVFKPAVSGVRNGAISLLTSGSVPTHTAYITGNGAGAQVAFDPGTPHSLSPPHQFTPHSVAVDGAGNTYALDWTTYSILKLTPGGLSSTYMGPFTAATLPYQIVLDSAGNLYYATDTTLVSVSPAPALVPTTIMTGLANPAGLTVDGAGNLFVSNTGYNTIMEYNPTTKVTTKLAIPKIAGLALSYPCGLAIDQNENLYIADSLNNRIVKVPVGAPATSTVISTRTGATEIQELAIGNNGSLYIADPNNGQVLRWNPNTPAVAPVTLYSGNILGLPMVPTSLALDGSENLYIADGNIHAQRVVFINRTAAGVDLQFANSVVGATSPDSPQNLTVLNIGSSNLTFTVPTTGQNPVVADPGLAPPFVDFSLGAASTCPTLTSASAPASLASLATCTYSVSFKPTALGTRTGTITVTDNAINPASPNVQSLYLTGIGTTPPTPAQAILTPSSLNFTSQIVGTHSAPQTLTLSNPGGSTLTGIATPTFGGAQAADFSASNNNCGTTLAAGATCTFAVAYTPVATGAASGTVSLVTALGTDKTTLTGTGVAGTTTRVVWVPDYEGKLLQVRVGITASPVAITVALPSNCNPNSVAVNATYAFVVCNANTATVDQILVYNAAIIRNAPAGALAIAPLYTWTGGANGSATAFSELIGSTFDAAGNLWISSQGNNNVYSISAASLGTANPVITPQLANSPSSPAGLAFAADGSLWITGQLSATEGIVLNMPAAQFGTGGQTPASCIVNGNNAAPCIDFAGDLTDPEGVAIVGSNLWVAVNGGSTPGRQLVQFPLTGDAPGTGVAFGNAGSTTASPFVCPGALFATSLHLWIDDESYGEANPKCGAALDTASQTGGVFSYTPAELANHDTSIADVLAFPNITGRPGFGGLWVENDQPSSITAATVALSGLAATYTASPIAAIATTNSVGLSVNLTYAGSTTPPTAVGSYAVAATINSPGYTGSTTGTLVISKGTPTINWPTPANAVAPATLSGTQLDATATNGAVTVAGAFVYTPPAGTIYATPGTENLKVQFTPTDIVDYNIPAAATQTLTVTAAAANPRVVWIPNFQGQALNVEIGTGAATKLVTVALPAACFPNSVVVKGTNAYVACSLYSNGSQDEILVYNATTIHNAAAGALILAPTQTITNAKFNGLIGQAFDASGNLWIASGGNFANNGTIEEISSATLNTTAPSITVAIPNGVNGLVFPTGLAFNTDGSLWVTDNTGILLNFPASQLTKGAAAVPEYCIATTDIENGKNICQTQNGIFPSPEGVAVFGGKVWVANNNQGGNGNGPGLSLTSFSFTPGTPGTVTPVETYGAAAGKPFSCPGGLFAGSVNLWVNDESYNENNPQCGANGDVSGNVGGIFAFTPAQLIAASTAALPVYTNVSSRPGFGGIFVENDQ